MKKVIERKNGVRIIVAIGLILAMRLVYAQVAEIDFVPLQTVKKVAINNATSMWGEVYAAEPITYYDLNDEIVAYMFNFRKLKPFPDHTAIQSVITQANPRGKDEYCHITINARYSEAPVEQYAECLSEDIFCKTQMEEMAREALGASSVELVKVYFIDPFCKWYMYTSDVGTVYVNPRPPARAYLPPEFEEKVKEQWLAWIEELEQSRTAVIQQREPTDYRTEWTQQEAGILMGFDEVRYIPMHELMPYYDWHLGCTPTAAAMCLAYFDKIGIEEGYQDYGRFVSHHYSEWDNVEKQHDTQIPDVLARLAHEMKTDSEGSTWLHNVSDGIEDAAKIKGHGCDADWHSSLYQSTLRQAINAGRPCLLHTSNHSEAVVGYMRFSGDLNPKVAYTHDTHYETINSLRCKDWYNLHTIEPSNPGTGTIELLSPLGDTTYAFSQSGDGTAGELLQAGQPFKIRWRTNKPDYGAVKIYYTSPETGAILIAFVSNTGVYQWTVPSNMPSTQDGRILLFWEDTKGGPIAEDGSFGPFRVAGDGGTPVPVLPGLVWYNKEPPNRYKCHLPGTHHWAVAGLRPPQTRSLREVRLYSDTLFAHRQVTDVLPGSPTPQDRIGFVVCSAVDLSTPCWLGVDFYESLVDPGFSEGVAQYNSSGYLGWGRNDLFWAPGEVARMYDLPLLLKTFEFKPSTDTIWIKLVFYGRHDTRRADMGIALYDHLTTYKWDNRETPISLDRYADTHGRSEAEIIELTNNISPINDTCGLVVFAKNECPFLYNFGIEVVSSRPASLYKPNLHLLPDSVFQTAYNPTTLSYDKIKDTWGIIGVKPTEGSGWAMLVTEDPSPDTVDTLAYSCYGYPFTNFCVFDFGRLDSVPEIMLERQSGGGSAKVQYNPGSGELSLGSNGPFTWNAKKDIIKVWTLDLGALRLADSVFDYKFSIKLDVTGDAALKAGAVYPPQVEEEGEDICLGRAQMAGFFSEDSTWTFYGDAGHYGIVVWSENEASAEFSIEIAQEGGMDVGVNAIDIPDRVQLGDSIFPEATVENYGPMTADFNVECIIEPGGYIDTKTITGLEPGTTQDVDFKVWIPGEIGEYTVTVTTKLEDTNPDNNSREKTISVTGIVETKVPSKFELSCIRPNPFSEQTVINYQLPVASKVSLTIYDISGKLMKTLMTGTKDAGTYTVSWNGKDDMNKAVPVGIYFIRFEAGGYKATKKMLLLR